jgi:hypothetical protein
MGYKDLIDKNLTLAFNLVKDLAVEVSFIKKTGTTFSFTTSAVSHAASTTVPKKIVWTSGIKRAIGSNIISRKLIMSIEGIDGISTYDSIFEGGIIWKISAPILNNGFIITLEAHREL